MNNEIRYESTERLAKLLAEENFSVRFDNSASTAAFNPVDRILIFPIFENLTKAIIEGFACHEIGHAKFTSTENPNELCKREKLNMGILNIVEDARIEKAVKLKYPGTRRMFSEMYTDLNAIDFFGIEGDDLNTKSFPDRINLHYKLGVMANIQFNEAETDIVNDIDAMGLELKDFPEAIEVTKKIQELLKLQKKEKQQPEQQPKPADEAPSDEKPETVQPDYSEDDEDDANNDQDGESETDDEAEADSKSNKGETPEDETDDEAEAEGTSKSDETDAETDDDAEDDAEDGSSNKSDETDDAAEDAAEDADDLDSTSDTSDENHADELPDIGDDYDPVNDDSLTETDNALADNLKNAAEARTRSTIFNVELHKFSYKEMVAAHVVIPFDLYEKHCNDIDLVPDTGYSRTRIIERYTHDAKAIKRFASSLNTQFNMKMAASVSSRTRTSNTGMLDVNKLYQATYNDDVFLSNEIVEDGKNHGIILYIDYSGSMSGTALYNVLRQTMAMTSFCKTAGIPFKVYTFTTRSIVLADRISRKQYTNNPTLSLMQIKNMQLVEIANSEVSSKRLAKGFKRAYQHGRYLRFGATPMNDLIALAAPVMNNFKRLFSIDKLSLTVLTDGSSHNDFLKRDNYMQDQIAVRLPNGKLINNKITGHGDFAESNLAATILKAMVPDLIINIYGLVSNIRAAGFIGIIDTCNVDSEVKRALTNNNHPGIVDLGHKWSGFDRAFLVSNSKSDSDSIDLNDNIYIGMEQKDRLKQAKKNLALAAGISKINKMFATSFIDTIA